MDALTLFGLIAVTAMLVFYTLEKRSHWFILAFAVSCAMGSVYGFLQKVLAVRSGGVRLVCSGGPALVDRQEIADSFRTALSRPSRT
jgi:hypothetical protein